MIFSEKLQKAMQDLNLNQKQVCGLIGKSKGSVSQYLSGKQVPSKKAQSDIAVALGLDPNYFEEDQAPLEHKEPIAVGRIKKMLPEEAAVYLGLSKDTVRKGLQQGVFPWGYAIKTRKNRWTYFINANRFAAIEAVGGEQIAPDKYNRSPAGDRGAIQYSL